MVGVTVEQFFSSELSVPKRRWRTLPVLILVVGLPRPAPALQAQAQGSAKGAAASDEVFQSIDSLIRSHRYEDADRLLEDHLSALTTPASGYFRMGKLYFDHGEWSRSVPFLQKSLRLANQNDQAHLLLGLAWRELQKPDDAESELLTAARLNPNSDENAYMAGHQLLIDAKYEAALGYFYKAVTLNPRKESAFRALGMDQARLGNYGLAEVYYKKAIEVAGTTGTDGSAALTDLAFLLLLSHDRAKLSEGLKDAQQAAQLQPLSPDAHYLVGKALLKLDRVREAVNELLRAEKLNPNDSKPHFLLAQAFDRLGEHQKADHERKAVIRLRQHSAGAGIATRDLLPRTSD
jgi:protein O-GlcNAc transferase